MTRYDFSPLFRSTIGFDRMAGLLDTAMKAADHDSGYPPYDIMQADDDRYRLTLSIAGFSEDELTVEQQDRELVVSGSKNTRDNEASFLHRGIATRDFRRVFQLADHVSVSGANLSNGLLTIDLLREVPEDQKPRRIEIRESAPGSLLGKAKKLLSDKSAKAA
ncbi:Hsp20 family protein [Kordiimonas aestuarii]|uniref:Hsp20 family protein n=1 Tax=Kordiimonas aestuarii TaxID=1005925 RepID=UPI0021D28A33|nr:Hsp20 family protein [Kordiimonas aestuarii]